MRLLACVLTAALCWPSHAADLANVPADQLLTAPSGLTAQCMARTTTKHDGHEWTFVVPVPADRVTDFSAKGFKATTCAGLVSQIAAHKRLACEIAQGNDAVQRQTEAQLGIDARKLCTAVKLLLPDTASQ